MRLTRAWKHSFVLCMRIPLLMVAWIGGCIVLHWQLISQQSWLDLGMPGVYLNMCQRAGTLLFLVAAFASHELFYQDRACVLDECLSADRNFRLKLRCGHFLPLLIPVLLTTGTSLLYQVLSINALGVLDEAVLRHIVLACLLNIFFVQVIGVLFGAVLAISVGRIASYSLIAAGTLLTTNAVKNWVGQWLTSSGPVSRGIMGCLELFSIAAPDTDWEPDMIYGLPMEVSRWAAALFWITFLAALFLWMSRPKKQLRYTAPLVLLLCVSSLFLAGAMQSGNDSVLRLHDGATGAQTDFYYETTHEPKEAAAEFEILTYELDLTVRNRLYAQAELTVTQNPSGDHYLMTLYRGYQVTSVTDGEGDPLDYTREGHYLDILYPMDTAQGTIRIEYQGTGNRYFSNYQGIALPGYMPWYPKAGWLKLWDRETNSVKINIESKESEFYVHLDTELPVVSNLESTGECSYSGTATNVTFVGGLMTEKSDGGITYFDSPLNMDGLALDELLNHLDWAEEILGRSLDVDLRETTIICMPNAISRTTSGGNEGVAVLPDHVLLQSGIWLPDPFLERLVPQKEETDTLRKLVLYYLLSRDISESLYCHDEELSSQKPTLEELGSGEEDRMTEENRIALERLLRHQMEQYGFSEVLRVCCDYLASDDSGNQVNFLYSLEDELS